MDDVRLIGAEHPPQPPPPAERHGPGAACGLHLGARVPPGAHAGRLAAENPHARLDRLSWQVPLQEPELPGSAVAIQSRNDVQNLHEPPSLAQCSGAGLSYVSGVYKGR